MKRKLLLTLVSVLTVCAVFAGCSAAQVGEMTAASSVAYSTNNIATDSAYGAARPPEAAPAPAPSVPRDAVMEDYEYDMVDELAGATRTTGGGTGSDVEDTERKIVYTSDLNLQTKDFDAGIALVEELTASCGGYIQSSNVQGKNMYETRGSSRWANFSLRIPEGSRAEFISNLEQTFNITSNNLYRDDITDSYYDVQARLNSLTVQEEQLLRMLEMANSVEYLLEVQRELGNVRYEIESLTSAIRRMDNQVSFSTVNISIEEVVEYQPVETVQTSFGERLLNSMSQSWQGFVRSGQEFLIALIYVLPFLMLLAIIAAAAVFLILRRRRRILSAAHSMPGLDQPADAAEQKSEPLEK